MLLFRGLTLVVLKGATVGEPARASFEAMGNGFLPESGPTRACTT
jgi:putative multiple sugar transport system permease protein